MNQLPRMNALWFLDIIFLDISARYLYSIFFSEIITIFADGIKHYGINQIRQFVLMFPPIIDSSFEFLNINSALLNLF